MLYESCCHGDAIHLSLYSQLIPRNHNSNAASHQLPKQPGFPARQMPCVQHRQRQCCYCASEDEVLLKLIALWEHYVCLCLQSCVLLTLRCCIFSGPPHTQAREFYSLAWSRHKAQLLHLETDVLKHKLYPLTKISPLWDEKNPKTLFWRLSAVYLYSQMGFELMGPRRTKPIL